MPSNISSIIGRIQAPQIAVNDPMESAGRALQLKGLIGQQELQGLQADEARKGIERNARIQALFSQNPAATSADVMTIDPKTGMAMRVQELDARAKQSTIDRNTAQGAKAKFEQDMDRLNRGAAILDTAKDQPSYEAALRMGQIAGIFAPEAIANFPTQYTPEAVKALQNAGLTRAQQLEQQNRERTFAETQANNPFNTGPGGVVVPNLPVQEYKKDVAKKGAPNIEVKTDVKMGESLGKEIGPMMRDSTIIAEGAVKQVDAAQRIVNAVDSGKLFAGPLASGRVTLAQVSQVMGIGGKDEAEKLANTRQAVRGLAELTLQGRQQMRGQGAITESEGKLAERAMSGDINELTIPEIRQLAKASERAARYNYAEHQRKLKVMQGNPSLSGISPFYEGPQMPAEGKSEPAVSAPAKPKIGATQDGYIFKGGNPADPKSWEKI